MATLADLSCPGPGKVQHPYGSVADYFGYTHSAEVEDEVDMAPGPAPPSAHDVPSQGSAQQYHPSEHPSHPSQPSCPSYYPSDQRVGVDMSEGELTESSVPAPPKSEPPTEDDLLDAEAGSLRKMVKVEDWLMDVGAGYEEHVAKLRAERVKLELLELQDKPKITQHAQTLTRGNVPVEDRLMNVHYKRVQKDKERQDMPHEDENTYRPLINRVSKEKSGKWNKDLNGTRKAEKISQLRNQLLEEESRTMRDAPRINAHSERLASKRTNGMSVEEYLLHNDKMHKQEMYERHERESSEGLQGQPSITKHASALRREGDVTTRLYDQRFGFDISELNASIASRKEKGVLDAYRHRGEQESFHPKINKRSESVKGDQGSHEKVEEKLHRKHMEIAREREQAFRRLQTEAREASSKVHTSKQSEAIYAAADLDLTEQRRVRRKQPPPQHTPAKKISSTSFMQRLNEWDSMRAQKAQDTETKRREKVRQEMAECTFDPFKSRSVRRARSSGISRHSIGAYTEATLADRTTSWLHKKESKIARQKMEGKQSELEGCTFVPYINQDMPNMDPANDEAAYGYNEFVNRLRKARQDKEANKQREEETFSQGRKWTGEATTPMEFNLGGGKQGRENIRSLGKVGPPEHMFVNNYFPEEEEEEGSPSWNTAPPPFAFPRSTTVDAGQGQGRGQGQEQEGSPRGYSVFGSQHAQRPSDVSNFLASQHESVMAMVRP